MTRRRLASGGLAATALAWGYWYHQTDLFTSIDSSKWYQNGTVSASGIGLVGGSGNGGALVSKTAVPYSPTNYEVRTRIRLSGTGGGDYVSLLRASNDTLPWVSGSYYSVEWFSPTCDTAGNCAGTLVVYKKLAGQTPVALGSVSAATSSYALDLRAVMTGSSILVWVNYSAVLWVSDGSITSGQPGVGARNTPSGSSIEKVEIGHLDQGAPAAVGNPVASRFPQQIRLRWTVPADPGTVPEDNGTGTGAISYEVHRNGVFMGLFTNASAVGQPVEWIDPNPPGATSTVTYVIYAWDYHWNHSAATTIVVQPSAVLTTYDARQVGVKALGTYWGSGGESIDMRSGNLNYSMPLVQAQLRGGAGVTVGLNYNSQNWQKLGNVEWRVGKDVGFGFGWRMLVGSVTPIYENGVIIHYVFADSTGAEYKLAVNTGGVWTSVEGVYVSYDTNVGPHRLYFNSGTFWEMGSVAGGIEEDIGTRYPTRVRDSNGNYILIRYNTGVGASGADTSSRIKEIEDVRAVQSGGVWKTYEFVYAYGAGDTFPHLRNVNNFIQSGETYWMGYWPPDTQGGYAHQSPFTGVPDPRPTRQLSYVSVVDLNLTYATVTNAYGEMTRVTMPYGGALEWDYGTQTYTSTLLSKTEVTTGTSILLILRSA